MRKLNQNELAALASRAYQNLEAQAKMAQEQLNAIQDRENAKIVAEQIEQVKEFDKLFKALPASTRKVIQDRYGSQSQFEKRIYGQLAKGIDPEERVKSMRKTQITVKLPEQPSHYNKYNNQLYMDLTVAQIDSDNVDDLLNKVARRYVKTPGAGATA